MHQELLVGGNLRRAVQLHPELQPHAAFAGVDPAHATGALAPAVVGTVALQLQTHGRLQRHEHLLGTAERAGIEIVEMRIGRPVVEHAHDAETGVGDAQRAAHAVGATEEAAVELAIDHHVACPGLVVEGIPAAAIAKRRAEHGKEIGGGETRLHVERIDHRGIGLHRHVTAGHQRLSIRPFRMQQVEPVGEGDLRRRLLAGHLATVVAWVDLRVIQRSAAPRQRITRQHVQHRKRGHRRTDAQRDRQHHQHGERLVAPQAAQGQVEVVREHALFLRNAIRN